MRFCISPYFFCVCVCVYVCMCVCSCVWVDDFLVHYNGLNAILFFRCRLGKIWICLFSDFKIYVLCLRSYGVLFLKNVFEKNTLYSNLENRILKYTVNLDGIMKRFLFYWICRKKVRKEAQNHPMTYINLPW